MKSRHSGLDLAGIIIIYVFSSILFSSFLVNSIQFFLFGYNIDGFIFFLLSLFSIFVLIMTIFYHSNITTNYIAIGILGIFVSIIGGIFILVGRPETNTSTPTPTPTPTPHRKIVKTNKQYSAENRLNQLNMLLEKGMISGEEYDKKRKSILNEI